MIANIFTNLFKPRNSSNTPQPQPQPQPEPWEDWTDDDLPKLEGDVDDLRSQFDEYVIERYGYSKPTEPRDGDLYVARCGTCCVETRLTLDDTRIAVALRRMGRAKYQARKAVEDAQRKARYDIAAQWVEGVKKTMRPND